MKLSGSSLAKVDRSSALYSKLRDAHLRIEAKDPKTWGSKASAEAAIRLNWVDLPDTSPALYPALEGLLSKFAHCTTVVLCGMGGSSLGPEVISKTFKKQLVVLDSTDPHSITHANQSLASTVFVVSSKSGSTIETSSQRAYFESALKEAGLDPIKHMLFVTDPGSPLDIQVREAGFTVINADPHVGGRFSVLSAFGLTPAALIGAPYRELIETAAQEKSLLLKDPTTALDVAYLFSEIAGQFIEFTDHGSEVPGLSDWIEQLIAESTGKDSTGRLPIAVPSISHAKTEGAFSVAFEGTAADLVAQGELGAHFFFWEWVTALLGVALSIDPFNQPNVTEAKEQTAKALEEWNNVIPPMTPQCSDGNVEIFGDGQSLTDALATFIEDVKDGGYIAIMAYLDRTDDVKISQLQEILAKKSGHPTSFGWGPRFMHSTGQFHKGGQKNGSFLQITGESELDFEIPGRGFGFKTLLMAQAIGDNRALATRKYPLLRLHCKNRSAGIDEIIAAAQKL